MDPSDRAAWRSAAFNVVVVAIALGFGLNAWSHPDEHVGTSASLFPQPVVDLRVANERGVAGFISEANLAPGDIINGTLILVADGAPDGVADLDFDLRLESHPERARAFDILRFTYGDDDLLSSADGGRNLLIEIDANPIVGDGNGKITLDELAAGVNDVPPPLDSGRGGSRFFLELQLDVEWSEQSTTLAKFDFVFLLADRLHGDLN